MSTQWDRIEPHTRSENLEEGLQARIADPLWMLARQWQLGELRGEDAASPVKARVSLATAPLRSFRNEAVSTATPERLHGARPLEARVEAETVLDGPARVRLAADAGLALARRLERAGLGSLRTRLRGRFPLVVPGSIALPERELRRLRLLASRAIDGEAVRSASRADLAGVADSPHEREGLVDVIRAWRDEVDAWFVEPGASGDTWVDERLAYDFSIAATGGERDGEVVLASADYPGGHLDWYAFDIDAASTHSVETRGPTRTELELIPLPLSYPGMPASRWWELEDDTVYFGGIEASTADLARLVVAEFGTIYSDDWFVLPIRAAVGSLVRIRYIDIVDSFGGTHRVRSTAVIDHEAQATGTRPWAFFELAGDASAEGGRTPWLALVPSLTSALDGTPLEEVSFVRDEAANMAWAIERRVETATGHSIERRLETGLAVESSEPTASPVWRYRIQASVPPNWIPLAAERVDPDRSDVLLRRARLLAWDELPAGVAGAHGRILVPDRPLRIREESIPAAGVQVTRGWQLARGADGALYLWMARRKRNGRGDRGSGLRFDIVET